MRKIWARKARSYKEAEENDRDYYSAMSRMQRLETIQFLREVYYKIKGMSGEGRKRLRRVVRIIQQK